MTKLDYGKYKGILISIVLFLILDASVLIMNFYISFEIADDAVGVNIAGRQRMLSQRMMKSLFDIQTSVNDPIELDRSVNELSATTNLFNRTFIAFDQGGETMAPNGEPATLAAVSSQDSLDAMSEAKGIWTPYQALLTSLLAIDPVQNPEAFTAELDKTIEYGRANNLTLLALMNKLTGDLERVASSKADTLRLIQTVGISLALLNFFIIIFHSVRQLRESDQKIFEAQNETQEILDNVNEGLFLLDDEGFIGAQYSAELEAIMGRDDIAGLTFNRLLKGLVSESTLETANKFIGLVFDTSKKEKLIGTLNPLKEIEIHIADTNGIYRSKFLNFAFSRVLLEGEIQHVLVTVKDITKQVQLARELEAAKEQGEQQFEMLTTLINGDSKLIPMYLDNSLKTLKQINEILRMPEKSKENFVWKANEIFSLMHSFKGESAALSLDQFADMAHEFESTIEEIKRNPKLSGNDFLPLTIQLNKLLSHIETAQKLMEKVSAMAAPSAPEQDQPVPINPATNWDHLGKLASQIAVKHDKTVDLVYSGLSDPDISPEVQNLVNSISIQLIRNSVVHGIEAHDDRQAAQKTPKGLIDIRLSRRSDGSFEYHYSDDGKGLDIEAIRISAITKGLITEAESESMDRKKLIGLIFSPDLSTAGQVDEDAGRGVGMAAIQKSIKALGGKLSISTRRGMGCSFKVSLPAPTIAIAAQVA